MLCVCVFVSESASGNESGQCDMVTGFLALCSLCEYCDCAQSTQISLLTQIVYSAIVFLCFPVDRCAVSSSVNFLQCFRYSFIDCRW